MKRTLFVLGNPALKRYENVQILERVTKKNPKRLLKKRTNKEDEAIFDFLDQRYLLNQETLETSRFITNTHNHTKILQSDNGIADVYNRHQSQTHVYDDVQKENFQSNHEHQIINTHNNLGTSSQKSMPSSSIFVNNQKTSHLSPKLNHYEINEAYSSNSSSITNSTTPLLDLSFLEENSSSAHFIHSSSKSSSYTNSLADFHTFHTLKGTEVDQSFYLPNFIHHSISEEDPELIKDRILFDISSLLSMDTEEKAYYFKKEIWLLYSQLANSHHGVKEIPLLLMKNLLQYYVCCPGSKDQMASLLRDLSMYRTFEFTFFFPIVARMARWTCKNLQVQLEFIQQVISRHVQQEFYDKLIFRILPDDIELLSKLKIILDSALDPPVVYPLVLKKLLLCGRHMNVLSLYLKAHHSGIKLCQNSFSYYLSSFAKVSAECIKDHLQDWYGPLNAASYNCQTHQSPRDGNQTNDTPAYPLLSSQNNLNSFTSNRKGFYIEDHQIRQMLAHLHYLMNQYWPLNAQDKSISFILYNWTKMMNKLPVGYRELSLISYFQSLNPSYELTPDVLMQIMIYLVSDRHQDGLIEARQIFDNLLSAKSSQQLACHGWIVGLIDARKFESIVPALEAMKVKGIYPSERTLYYIILSRFLLPEIVAYAEKELVERSCGEMSFQDIKIQKFITKLTKNTDEEGAKAFSDYLRDSMDKLSKEFVFNVFNFNRKSS